MNRKSIKTMFATVGMLFVVLGAFMQPVSAQPLDESPIQTGKVLDIIDERIEVIEGTNLDNTIQTLEVKITSGPDKGTTAVVESGYLPLRKGTRFYFERGTFEDPEAIQIVEIDRRRPLALLVGIFVLIVILFARFQGVKALLALAVSFLSIIFILAPGILNGWNPLLASFIVSACVLFVAIFLTHGWNRESVVAYSGTMFAVLITGLFTVGAVYITHLTGLAEEASFYLDITDGIEINLTALLLGGFIIGFLGVLDDIAITQTAIVVELYDSNPDLTSKEVYQRAMRVGREHTSALVNTLILAYTGTALPLVVYFKLVSNNFSQTINLEIFATEIVRIVVGSVGLILTVPIVTLLAVKYLKGHKPSHPHGHICGLHHDH
jgi:uncharacterized membrane protein